MGLLTTGMCSSGGGGGGGGAHGTHDHRHGLIRRIPYDGTFTRSRLNRAWHAAMLREREEKTSYNLTHLNTYFDTLLKLGIFWKLTLPIKVQGRFIEEILNRLNFVFVSVTY